MSAWAGLVWSTLVAFGAFGTPAARAAEDPAPELVVKMATTAPEHSPVARQLQRLAAILEQRSKDQVRVKVLPAGRAGDDDTMLEALDRGAMHIYAARLSAFTRRIPELEMLTVPLVVDRDGTMDALLDGPVARTVSRALERQGWLFGAWGPTWRNHGFEVFEGAVPEASGDTLGGSRYRAPIAGVLGQGAESVIGAGAGAGRDVATEASATVPPRAVWLTSAVDGRANGEGETGQRIWPHLGGTDGYLIVMSGTWFEGLPARLQGVFGEWPQAPTSEARHARRQLERTLLQRMSQRGSEVVELTPVTRAAAEEAVAEAAAARASDIGPRAMALYRRLRAGLAGR